MQSRHVLHSSLNACQTHISFIFYSGKQKRVSWEKKVKKEKKVEKHVEKNPQPSAVT